MKGTVRCPVCGELNAADAARCRSCWGELGEARVGYQIGERGRDRPRWPYIVGILGIFLLVCALIVYNFLIPHYPRTGRVGLMDVTVTGRDLLPDEGPIDAYYSDPSGVTFQTLRLAIQLRNNGSRERFIDTDNQFRLIDRENLIYEPLPPDRGTAMPDIVPPGGEVAGELAFRIKQRARGWHLVVTFDRVTGPVSIWLD